MGSSRGCMTILLRLQDHWSGRTMSQCPERSGGIWGVMERRMVLRCVWAVFCDANVGL